MPYRATLPVRSKRGAVHPNAPQPLLELALKYQRLAEIKLEMEKLAKEFSDLRKNLWK